MGAAVQPRINAAITDRLRSDTLASPVFSGDSLQVLMQAAGANLEGGDIPLYWDMAPSSAKRPYLVFGPQQRESQAIAPLCGNAIADEVPYEIRLSLTGINPQAGIGIVDRIGDLLDRYRATVEGMVVELYRVGDFCYPDFGATERGATVSGIVYRCRVHL